AKDWLRMWNKRGMMHILMNYGGAYVGGLCNCDYPDCIAIRMRVDLGAGMLKSHYVCKVDYDRCNGCKDCLGRCFFNSLKYEVTIRKANIDLTRCFGCGLCQTACGQDAIELLPRANFPVIADSW
ncbi:MAG: 4Fe-4S binding protein, partial [Candidatus Marsarchaeota archaeon]|nr:4Fe-4S binding protein [Candidatus Marsarchaeota archaeon]